VFPRLSKRRRAQSPEKSTQRKRGQGAERGLYSTVHPRQTSQGEGRQHAHDNQRFKGGRWCRAKALLTPTPLPNTPVIEQHENTNNRQRVEAMPPAATQDKGGRRWCLFAGYPRGGPSAKLTPADGVLAPGPWRARASDTNAPPTTAVGCEREGAEHRASDAKPNNQQYWRGGQRTVEDGSELRTRGDRAQPLRCEASTKNSDDDGAGKAASELPTSKRGQSVAPRSRGWTKTTLTRAHGVH
jgi:hypothetical protein